MPRRLISALGAALLSLTVTSAVAAPPPDEPSPAGELATEDIEAIVNQAIEAWRAGEWTKVRDLLEPLVRDADLEDEFLNESALRYLAEATLLDVGLEEEEAKALAKGYIERQFDRKDDWQAPSGLHGRKFYDAVAEVYNARNAQKADACRGQLLACEADLAEIAVDYGAAQERIETLQEDLANEDVFVTEVVRRNRGLAFLPLGISHFVNGTDTRSRALGGTFLALEVISGVGGLSLIIFRNTVWGCTRTNGLNRDSLKCADIDVAEVADEAAAVDKRNEDIAALRRVETAMGWIFLGSVVLDITLAQVLFKPVEIVERGSRTRRELDAEIEAEGPAGARPSASAPTRRSNVRLRLRPSPTLLPRGAGFGVTLQF